MAKTPEINLRKDYQRNYIINGNFDFWQRGTSLAITAGSLDKIYLADRWSCSNFFNSGQYTVARDTDVPPVSSALYSRSITVNTDISLTLANHHFNPTIYRFEGYDSSLLLDKTITCSFWVKSSKTGLYTVAFGNNFDAAGARYLTTITVNQANTWEKKSVALNIDSSSGLFDKESGQGLFLSIPIASGADRVTLDSDKDTWLSGEIYSVLDSANRIDFVAGDVFKLAQVQLTEGREELPFRRAGRNIGEELSLCQRYYELFALNASVQANIAFASWPINFTVTKRANPSLSIVSGSFSSASTLLESSSIYGCRLTNFNGPVAGSTMAGGVASANSEL